ncbi:MAG TPA: RnfABCDGE type electron transport complex subunit D [Firmicutes bacterium]|nr:RnfABCDGE type electron transport complex subunit D [Bacillota bacterium]
MRWVLIALAPSALYSVYLIGTNALSVILVSVLSCLGVEVIWHNLRDGKHVSRTWWELVFLLAIPLLGMVPALGAFVQWIECVAILVVLWFEREHRFDGSAAVTGLLLAMVLPPMIPWWVPFFGAILAIAIGKEIFGGLGYNVFNPALVARAALLISWPRYLTAGWFKPVVDASTSATPLVLFKNRLGAEVSAVYGPLLFSNTGGCIGEVSAFLLLLGGLVLAWKKVIHVEIPLAYLGTMAVFAALAHNDPIFHLLAGGAMLGAWFMATDYVTSPLTTKGRILFGVGCGFITMLLRLYGKAPEGVTYAILFMNMLTPLIDRSLRPRVYGHIAKPVRGGK